MPWVRAWVPETVVSQNLSFGGACHACIAVAMAVVLRLLHGIDLIRHGLDILCFIWRDLLNAFILPVDILPISHYGLVFAFI